ncbi:MAG: tRNA (adenosine(37)-N6)-dimethylallyltransferase MiaA [Candidatus Saccharimonadales bacterium]
MSKPPKLVAIVGETASGKSAIALELARRHNGEIINADSWQVYREMDIGTAKPSSVEQSEVPHHLIDIVAPDQDFTAAVYKELAQTAISEVVERGKLPILVGGTGLYIDCVLFDYSFMPPGKAGERASLQAKSIPELLKQIEVAGYDLTAVDIRNKRRLIRLIETRGQTPKRTPLRKNTLVVGVHIPRAQLRKNIESRVEVMLRRGLKHEVRELAEKYGWEVEAMRGIGYREWQAYFESNQSNQETRRRIIKATLDLAKRQRTWFKRNRDIIWVSEVDEADRFVEKFLDTV